jgi:hypothetical protein
VTVGLEYVRHYALEEHHRHLELELAGKYVPTLAYIMGTSRGAVMRVHAYYAGTMLWPPPRR